MNRLMNCDNVVYSFRRFLASIMRAPRSHGFGVQSPFAFDFITEVVRRRGDDVEDAMLTDTVDNSKIEFVSPKTAFAYSSNTKRRLNKFYHRLSEFVGKHDEIERVYVVEGIHCCGDNCHQWTSLCKDEAVTVSFDVFDCGVAFRVANMYKNNYKVILL